MTIRTLFGFLLWCSVAAAQVRIEGKEIRIEFDRVLHSRVSGGQAPIGPWAASESIETGGREVSDFRLAGQKSENVLDRFGRGHRVTLIGTAPSLKKAIVVSIYDEFPRTAFFAVEYANTGDADLAIGGWTNHRYAVAGESFWSYQSGSYSSRPDWVLPLKPGFKQENFLGMNATDYGGGTPVVDIWRKDAGIGVGHLELTPKLVSLPVAMPAAGLATLALHYKTSRTLKPGETMKTFRTFVEVHHGDYFQTLTDYRRMMEKQGIVMDPAPEAAFAPIWCAWGFGKQATPAQITAALPVVKKIGFGWVGVDWGWESFEGDGTLDVTKFPNGDRDMKALVDRIHAEGFKAQLWWGPLNANPQSELVKHHPERLLLNADGSKRRITFWNGWYLCPADPEVVDQHRRLAVKIIKEWGFDGLKLDGMHMNAAPPCYNPAHKHARPEESVEAMPAFFKAIYEAARSAKPGVMVEFCLCGTSYNFFTLPYLNMSVASDPRGSFQVRLKAKTLKALHGDGKAYFGDHVELSTGHDDFASTIGVGGVVGREFTWPAGAAQRARNDLTPEKQANFSKWLGIYKDKMLSRGEYLGGLYDIGFDRPEAHAIRKGGVMYYSFYAPVWNGRIELRGLETRGYRITDYLNGADLGTVRGPAGTLNVRFNKSLLLEARPE